MAKNPKIKNIMTLEEISSEGLIFKGSFGTLEIYGFGKTRYLFEPLDTEKMLFNFEYDVPISIHISTVNRLPNIFFKS